MARAKKAAKKAARIVSDTTPKFPYTNKPGSLRRFLKEVPSKPKPLKFDQAMMKSWGFSDTNDMTMLRVLKAVDLLGPKNEPTEKYSQFMNLDGGAKALAPEIKRVYAPLFEAALKPYEESNEKLKNLFNIHSGGGDRAIELQIQTFKSLCDNADFDGVVSGPASLGASGQVVIPPAGSPASLGASININLHIHLPENKSRREYEDLIEDIGKYIFGRTIGVAGDR